MKFANQRQGASLIVVLALLAVCSAILLQLLTASLQQRIQMRRDLQREQTQWLLRAGVQNATIELKENDGELPAGFAIEVPNFEAAKLSYTEISQGSGPTVVKILAQIGEVKSPRELTALSSEFKVPSDDNNNPNQE